MTFDELRSTIAAQMYLTSEIDRMNMLDRRHGGSPPESVVDQELDGLALACLTRAHHALLRIKSAHDAFYAQLPGAAREQGAEPFLQLVPSSESGDEKTEK
jgi:hypothetical protein